MIKATFIARSSDSFLLCEYSDSMVRNYSELRTKAKKLLQSDKCKTGDVEFIEIDRDSYVQ